MHSSYFTLCILRDQVVLSCVRVDYAISFGRYTHLAAGVDTVVGYKLNFSSYTPYTHTVTIIDTFGYGGSTTLRLGQIPFGHHVRPQTRHRQVICKFACPISLKILPHPAVVVVGAHPRTYPDFRAEYEHEKDHCVVPRQGWTFCLYEPLHCGSFWMTNILASVSNLRKCFLLKSARLPYIPPVLLCRPVLCYTCIWYSSTAHSYMDKCKT